MEKEEFRDAVGFENLYQVSNYGRVYSIKRQKFLKSRKNKGGYLLVNLCKNGKMKTCYVHRLVATAFLENKLQLPQVNHISEDKTDNRVENLEWVSHKDNSNYGTRIERILKHPNWKATHEKITEKCSKAVLQFTKDGELINEYPSLMEASRQTKIHQGHISMCCNGKLKSCGNYIWRFK